MQPQPAPAIASEMLGHPAMWWGQLAAGIAAGSLMRTALAPLDAARLVQQASPVARGSSGMTAVATMRQLWARGGLEAIFAGNLYNCIRFVPFSAAFAIAFPIVSDKLEPLVRRARNRARAWIRENLPADQAQRAAGYLPSPSLLSRNCAVAASARTSPRRARRCAPMATRPGS